MRYSHYVAVQFDGTFGIFRQKIPIFIIDKKLVVKEKLRNLQKNGSGCGKQRMYRWIDWRKLVILYCYLLLHQLHRSFITQRLVTSKCLTANKRNPLISCKGETKYWQRRSFVGQAKHVAKWLQCLKIIV